MKGKVGPKTWEMEKEKESTDKGSYVAKCCRSERIL